MSVRSAVAHRVLFPLMAYASGNGFWGQVRRRVAELGESQWYAEERIHGYQLSKLQALVCHAAETVPFYAERFRAIGLEPDDVTSLDIYARIPPLTRQDLREHYDELLANGSRDRVEDNATGGSSGQPVRFAVDKSEPCMRTATAIRHNRWVGWDIGDRAGFVWGAPRDLVPVHSLRERITEAWLTPHLTLNAFEITENKAIAFLEQLRGFRAEVLFGYAGSLAELARLAQIAGERVPTLRTVISSAEALTSVRKRAIEEWSGCPVYDRYGSRETGLIASECAERSGLHVAWEDHLVELKSAGHSGLCRVFVTKLNSYGMPFLRYDIGDLARWQAGSCPCGRHAPRLVMGGCRDTDFLIGADGRKVSGCALTLIVRDLPELGTVQLYRSNVHEVEVRLAGRASLPPHLQMELRQRMNLYLGPVAVDIKFVDQIPRAPSGKFRFTICEIPQQPELTSVQ